MRGETRCLERDGAGLNWGYSAWLRNLGIDNNRSVSSGAQSFTPSHRSHLRIHSVELVTPEGASRSFEKIAVLVSIIVEKAANLVTLPGPDALYISNPVLCENC